MGERELSKLRGVGDFFIADIAKPLHAADKLFFLVVPTDDANCCLSNFQSLRIVGALNWQQGPTKQTKHRRWCAGRLFDA